MNPATITMLTASGHLPFYLPGASPQAVPSSGDGLMGKYPFIQSSGQITNSYGVDDLAGIRIQKTLMAMAPKATMVIDAYRRGLMLSFNKMTAKIALKIMEVSRSAATGAIGACVIAHSARL